MSFYDNQALGVVFRKFFGNSLKSASGPTAVTFTGSGSSTNLITRFYPKGPIRIVKFGFQVVATGSACANATGCSIRAVLPFKLYKSNGATVRATLMASDHMTNFPKASRSPALWGISSKETMASNEVEAGRFLTIYVGTPTSRSGTAAAAVGTVGNGGSYAFFIDYKQMWDPDGKEMK